jgi:hypothetical protein
MLRECNWKKNTSNTTGCMARFFRRSSSNESPQHCHCSESWYHCKQSLVGQENKYNHKNVLPTGGVGVVKRVCGSLWDRAADRSMFALVQNRVCSKENCSWGIVDTDAMSVFSHGHVTVHGMDWHWCVGVWRTWIKKLTVNSSNVMNQNLKEDT